MHNLIGFLSSHYGLAFIAIGAFFVLLAIRAIFDFFKPTYVRGIR